MNQFDLIVVGGGPAGSAAAWRAAVSGAKVLLIDKAEFPRDKPCGDGLTPRAVKAFTDIGLGNELKRFHRVDLLRVHGADRVLEFPWPSSDAYPGYGYVAARTELDELALRHAEAAGAEIRQGLTVRGPYLENGVVKGVYVGDKNSPEVVRALGVIAADGATSPMGKALGLERIEWMPFGLAVRAVFECDRPDDNAIESYLEIKDHRGNSLPGYGWLFPMGNGKINVGVGILSSYKEWKTVNTADVTDALLASMPPEWNVPPLAELRQRGDFKGWRLPMGLNVRQPWHPGLVAVGDACGAINPFNGEGISEAVETGVMGAEAMLMAIEGRGVRDLAFYEDRLQQTYGAYYRLGRTFARLIGKPKLMRSAIDVGMQVPPVMTFAFKVLSNIYMQSGGTTADAITRAMVRLASVIRVG